MRNTLDRLPFGVSVILGMLSCVLLIALVANLAAITKWTGYAFLWLPSKIGIVSTVSPGEVISADFSSNPTTVTFARPGTYNLYTSNLDLLELADATDESAQPWLTIRAAEGNDEPAPVWFITRGLAPFDTPFAKGRPIFRFVIEKPGTYTIRHPSRPTMVNFVPDYTTGHEKFLGGLIVFEMLVVVLVVGSYLRGRWKPRWDAMREARAQKRARSDAFWEEYRAKKAQKPERMGRRKRW